MDETIVIDTSVIISLLLGEKGPSREISRKALLENFKPLISNVLLQEHEDVSNSEQKQSICTLTNNELT